jgi:putative sigma-54 modulation protein
MKVAYTGKLEALTPAEVSRIETKFAKIAKLLDAKKGEREAHVILTTERHLNHAEITVRYYEHALVGVASATDRFTAITTAIDKLEKQILRIRERNRDTKRGPRQERQEFAEPVSAETAAQTAAAEAEPEAGEGPQVFPVNHHERRKPMTLDEALMEIEDRAYVVYRDAETNRVSVLLRRRDGNYDLVQA